MIIIFLSGCNLFDVSDKLLLSYQIKNNKIIEVHSVWYGEPRKDATLIEIKKEGGALETIKRIDSDYSNSKVKIIRVNNSIFKISFTDTIESKAMQQSYTFNINERLK